MELNGVVLCAAPLAPPRVDVMGIAYSMILLITAVLKPTTNHFITVKELNGVVLSAAAPRLATPRVDVKGIAGAMFLLITAVLKT